VVEAQMMAGIFFVASRTVVGLVISHGQVVTRERIDAIKEGAGVRPSP